MSVYQVAVDLALRRLVGPRLSPEFFESMRGAGWDGDLDEVATTEPVVMELLAGANTDRLFGRIEKLMGGMQLLPVDASVDYRDAAIACRAVRRGGHTVRKTMDCLIAMVAVRTGARLVHRDRDFDLLAAALPDLRVRSLV
jgi:predicted nucleic acid-binding protein